MNGLTPSKTGVADWPPGPTPRAARGAPEPSEGFAGLLELQARTATAEGHDRSAPTTARDRSATAPARERSDDAPAATERPAPEHPDDCAPRAADDETPAPTAIDGDQPASDDPTGTETSTTPEQDPAALLLAAALPAPVAAPVEPAVPAVAAVEQAAAQLPTAAAGAGAESGAAQPVAPVAPVTQPTATEPAAADVAQAVAVGDGAEGPSADKPATPGQAPASAPAGQTAVKRDGPELGQQGQGRQGQGQGQQGQGQQPGAQAAEQARAAQAYGRVAQPQAQQQAKPEAAAPAQPAAAPTVTPTAPAAVQSASARAIAQATPVPLSRAAETIEHILRLGSSRGTTHARVTLNPAELGSIDVHLRQTSEGLVARVIAHAPEAAQQLQQAAAELRRTLEQQGVNLLSLDIGQQPSDERSAGRAGSGLADDGSRGRGENAADGAASGDAGEVTTKTTLQLPNGVLVDVLA